MSTFLSAVVTTKECTHVQWGQSGQVSAGGPGAAGGWVSEAGSGSAARSCVGKPALCWQAEGRHKDEEEPVCVWEILHHEAVRRLLRWETAANGIGYQFQSLNSIWRFKEPLGIFKQRRRIVLCFHKITLGTILRLDRSGIKPEGADGRSCENRVKQMCPGWATERSWRAGFPWRWQEVRTAGVEGTGTGVGGRPGFPTEWLGARCCR